ncbi:MAG: hypothetical protein H3C30_15885 [Candidatus Hydrogenedentes bacterium]|nr:hypothetical protein [Candidatus Hydrogenedentota bacterium]
MGNKQPCPVCGVEVTDWRENTDERSTGWIDANYYDCPNCGQYTISGSALSLLSYSENISPKGKAILSHGIWCGQKERRPFPVMTALIEAAENGKFPNPAEQLDRLILYLGDNQESIGSHIIIKRAYLPAKIGASDAASADFIVEAAGTQDLLEGEGALQQQIFRLTMLGWQRYQDLQHGTRISKTAFMAMQFGDDKLDRMVQEAFRPAVTETGFTLKRVDDEPRAGLIDDRIRVEIRLCRFLIADLTHQNRGAYWEAGFAEGLGKPVIYTCDKQHFEGQGTHFDTNHHQTVLWNPDNPEEAAKMLKATIRATLPFEATMPKD